MNNRLIQSSLVKQRVAKVVVDLGVVGFHLERGRVVGDRFVQLSLLEQRITKIGFGAHFIEIGRAHV